MRPNVVIGVLERIEGPLLRVEIGGDGFGRAGFERPMHAFMRAVFLRMARRDALMGDAELQPPDVEAVEPMDAIGRERCAVVTADRSGEPTLAKEPFHAGLHAVAFDIEGAVTTE